jgi:polar amino acid transport system substrate-binding protein
MLLPNGREPDYGTAPEPVAFALSSKNRSMQGSDSAILVYNGIVDFAMGDLMVALAVRLAAAFLLCFPAVCAKAQTPSVFVPSFWDPQKQLEKPDLGGLHAIRFLTEDDYPPFHFAMPDGSLAGFDIDMARAICEELKAQCTIQQRRFDLLADALNGDQGDALIAFLRVDADNRGRFDFTTPYYATPARFVARADAAFVSTPEGLAGKKIGVIQKSAHEAYLADFFPAVARVLYPSRPAMRSALRSGEIDAFFDDGIASQFWLLAAETESCCAFRGGPFTESRYFGEGVGIAVKKGNNTLRRALDYALNVLARNGTHTDLYLKYFPIGFY